MVPENHLRALALFNERIAEIQGPDGEGATVSVQREGYPHWTSV